jgi:uncharacterized protein YunC (DUF1805 family)
MDIRRAVNEFVAEGRQLLERLQSAEGKTLPKTELLLLKVQHHLLQCEAANLEAQSKDRANKGGD